MKFGSAEAVPKRGVTVTGGTLTHVFNGYLVMVGLLQSFENCGNGSVEAHSSRNVVFE